MSAGSNLEVRVVRTFAASPERVFDAWLDPLMVGRFMFGSALRDEEVLRLEVDPRVGGAFSFLVRRQGAEIDHVGKYLEIERPRRLSFTWGIAGESEDESRVTVEVAPHEDGCELALTHALQPKWADFAGRVEAGWAKMLDALTGAVTKAARGYGVVTGPGSVRFERVLPGSIERAWAYLTEPEKRAKWLAGGEMELWVGGRIDLRFLHADLSPTVEPTPDRYKRFEGGCSLGGTVTRCEPPRLLSFTWGEGSPGVSEVTFDLMPRDGGVLLVLTHRRLDGRVTMVNVAGGWHTHLAILEDHLHGREPRPFWSTHARAEAEYERRFGTDVSA